MTKKTKRALYPLCHFSMEKHTLFVNFSYNPC